MWLLQASIREAIEQATLAGATPSAQAQAEYLARYDDEYSEAAPRILTIAGETASIAIRGSMTEGANLMAYLFGGGNTTYAEIQAAIAIAQADPQVTNIVYAIDSGGGTIDGLFDTLAAMQSVTKPTKAVVSNKAASAAYAIAAQADTIVATNRATRFGSVGIVASGSTDPNAFAVTSTDAPKKAPNMATEQGRAAVREELDALHQVFVESIADGRSSTVERINADFGQGATLLASEALERGMIDAVEGPPLVVVASANQPTTAASGKPTEASQMDLKKLKAEHGDLYAAVVAEGVAIGVGQNQDRVSAHLTLGTASGDMETAIAAINDGTEMTATMQSTYMAAGMRRAEIAARESDDTDASDLGALTPVEQADRDAKTSAGILSLAAEQCGVELGA
jgi:ClpP class serine protease